MGKTASLASLGSIADTSLGFRNRIINGDMRIDQRRSGSGLSPAANGDFLVDRFIFSATQASRFFGGQNYNSVTPPTGFTSYAGVQCSTSQSLASGDFFGILQRIEGLNTADLAWGSASASAVTLSFRVYSSLTGTFGGSVQNSGSTRSYPFSYSVSSANTWTTITVTIPGDTSGTWLTTNGQSIQVFFGLGVGSTYSGTAGSWAGSNLISATGAVSVVETQFATFYITGVQLEAGSVASPFERRDYGRELMMCQRYFYMLAKGSGIPVSQGGYFSSGLIQNFVTFPVTMRTTPSIYEVTGTNYYTAYTSGGTDNFDAIGSIPRGSPSTVQIDSTSGVSGTAGAACAVATNNANAALGFSAEL